MRQTNSGLGILSLYDPQRNPFGGLFPARDAASLKLGQASLAQNIRWEAGTLRSRWANRRLTPGPGVAGSPVGGWVGPFGSGQKLALVAWRTPAALTQIWGNVWNGTAWGGWFEVTAATGPMGNSRLTGTEVEFAAVAGGVIAQDGVSAPRFLGFAGLGAGTAAVIRAIDPPSGLTAFGPTYDSGVRLDISAAGSATASAPGRFSFDGAWRLTLASPQTGDWAEISAPAAALWQGGLQAWVVVSPGQGSLFDPAWLRFLRWELVVSGGGLVGLQDAASDQDSAVMIETGTPGHLLYAFPLNLPPGGLSVVGLRLTVTGGAWGSGTLDIKFMAEGGKVPAGATYGVAWRNRSTKTTGPGVVLNLPEGATSTAASQSLLTKGGVKPLTGSRLPGGFSFPLDGRLMMRVTVPVLAPSQGAGEQGVDQMLIYRRDPGESQFALVQEVATTTWNGSAWQPTPLFGSFGARKSVVDGVSTEAKDFAQRLPDAAVLPVPIGHHLVSLGPRLCVARESRVWLSELDDPFTFRATARTSQGRPELNTGYTAELPEGERVVALHPQPTSLVAFPALLVMGEKRLFRLARFELSQVAQVGCLAKDSVAEVEGVIFWLGRQGEVWRMAGGLTDIARDRVRPLTSLTAQGGGAKGRYWLTTPQGCLVWNERLKEWESEDLHSPTIARWLDWGEGALCALGADGGIWLLDQPGETGSVAGALRFSLPEAAPDQRVAVRRAMVSSDADPTGNVTITRRFRHGSSSSVGTISLAEGGWRRDQATAGGSAGSAGQGGEVTWEWQARGGLIIRGLAIEISVPAGGGPDV